MARPSIPQRQRFLVGVEGRSEAGYVRLIGNLVEIQGVSTYLDIVPLEGGDPQYMMERLDRQMGKLLSKGAYVDRFAFIDQDRLNSNHNRAVSARALATKLGVNFVLQNPCHEALLLTHLPNCGALRPSSTALAKAELAKHWQDYDAPMAANRLSSRVGEVSVRQAAGQNPALAQFLARIGFV